MASVYKTVSKSKSNGHTKEQDGEPKPKNRQRVLMLSSRGVTFRYAPEYLYTYESSVLTTQSYRHRHLLADLNALLPHSRKDAKLDTKTQLHQLNELADLYNCNNVMFFEARKGKDLYLWLSKPPNGPTLKFHLQNLHTMEELNFTGNCLKGSRPILSFDASFEKEAHTRVMKELLTHTFGVPQTSRKVKPFIDHVMGFTLAQGKVWIRCYEISETEVPKASSEDKTASREPSITAPKATGRGETSIKLIEIGPRLVLTPIVMLEGSFGGPVIFENKEFVSPNQIRSDLRRAKAGRYNKRAEGTLERKVKRRDLGLNTGDGKRKVDELDDRVLFA